MKREILKRVRLLPVFCIILAAIAVQAPQKSGAAEYGLSIDVSPKIINLASSRFGEIRIYTSFRYATYISSGAGAFVYFNENEASVENIVKTRDSWGNLILKFQLTDLLALGDSLVPDVYNEVTGVIVTSSGDEYIGGDRVFLTDKMTMGPDLE